MKTANKKRGDPKERYVATTGHSSYTDQEKLTGVLKLKLFFGFFLLQVDNMNRFFDA
jgi:hypothetical protein